MKLQDNNLVLEESEDKFLSDFTSWLITQAKNSDSPALLLRNVLGLISVDAFIALLKIKNKEHLLGDHLKSQKIADELSKIGNKVNDLTRSFHPEDLSALQLQLYSELHTNIEDRIN